MMAKTGRKSKYKDCAPLVLQKIAEGCTYADSCRYAGISIETFCKWRKQFIQFSEAVKKAESEFRAKIQRELETSLWKRAKGFEWEEVKQEMARDEYGNPVPVKQTITKKFTPPDTGALIFALTNLAPEKWRNRQFAETVGKDPSGDADIGKLTDEELEQYQGLLRKMQ